MEHSTRSMIGAAALAAVTLVPVAGWAAAEHHDATSAPAVPTASDDTRIAHMGGGAGPAGMGGQGMMGQGYGQPPCQGDVPGYGYGAMGPGMMGQGMMGSGMMGRQPGQYQYPGAQGRMPSMMGSGMMGSGMMGSGMMGRGYGGFSDDEDRVTPDRDLDVADVRHFLQHRLERMGNKRLKLGNVTEASGDSIVAEINTVDGSLVDRFEIDRHTGRMQRVE